MVVAPPGVRRDTPARMARVAGVLFGEVLWPVAHGQRDNGSGGRQQVARIAGEIGPLGGEPRQAAEVAGRDALAQHGAILRERLGPRHAHGIEAHRPCILLDAPRQIYVCCHGLPPAPIVSTQFSRDDADSRAAAVSTRSFDACGRLTVATPARAVMTTPLSY